MSISKEAKVGLLAVVAIVLLYLGFNFLKGSSIFSRSNSFYIMYDDIDGLTSSNPVLVNGLSVGRVMGISLLSENNNKLLVEIEIRKSVVVREGTVATLADGGLLGGKVIKLEMKPTGRTLESGDTLASLTEVGIAGMLQAKALPVLTQADSLVQNLNTVALGFKDTGKTLNMVLENLDHTGKALTGIMSDNRTKLAGLVNNLNQLSASLVETEKGIKPLMSSANTFLDSLNALQLGQTIATANKTLGELRVILANLEAGKGSVGKLLSDDKLYNNLNLTLVSLNQLLANFREHPKRYINVSVFGRKTDPGPTVSPIDTTLRYK